LSDKEEEQKQEEDDILELNKDQPTKDAQDIDLENVLANQNDKAKKFDISQFHGMDMERLNAYFGSVGDANNQIQIALSQLDKFVIPYNKSGDTIFADWTRYELKYHSVTMGAHNRRQELNAAVEDLGRQIQTVALKIQTMQQEVRDRQMRMMRGDNTKADLALSRENKTTLDNIRVEELQRTVKTLDEIPNNLNTDMARMKQDANWLGMQMYFHIKDREVFDNVRADHLDNILKACDLKQLGLPKSQELSKSSPMQVRQGVS
jgi:hypothetical protein